MLANYPVPFPVLMGLLGALVGSFLNVVILRLPEGKSIVYPPSSCPKCGDRIPPWLNLPILSWLFLRGRCRSCKEPISARYPLVELLTALLFVAVARRFGIEPAAIAGAIMVSGLIVITFIDIDYFEIPDEISIWGTVVGCSIRPWAFDVPWWSGLVGAALGGGFLMIVRVSYQLVRKQEGMGLGDIKLLAMIGAFLGPGSLLGVVLVASTFGSVYGLVAMAVEKVRGPQPAEVAEARKVRFIDENGEEWVPPPHSLPFGPFLALGAITMLLIGPALQRWFVMLRI
ncbi:MAG: prepilin peptidase [Myxococcota bacterium]